jgi:hypothetical protein
MKLRPFQFNPNETFPTSVMPIFTGDVVSPAGSTVVTLANVNTSSGTFGSGAAIPIITVNAKGLVTAVSTSALSLGTAGSKNIGTSGATVPLLNTANTWSAAQTFSGIVMNGDILPAADSVYSLGSATKRWKDIFVSANTIHLGDATQLSGTSIIVDAGGSANSLSDIPTVKASKLVAVPYTYNPGGGPIMVRPSIEFQINGDSYPISLNTSTFEFSLDAQGNYGTGSLVAKKISLLNVGTALAVTGDQVLTGMLTHSGSYNNQQVGSIFRFDGDMMLGYDAARSLTVKGTTTFLAPVAFQGAATIGDGNDTVAINAGANNFTVTANNFSVAANGNVVVGGNLTVTGSTFTVNSNEVNIGDAILLLNSDISSGAEPSENGGIQIARGAQAAAKWLWDETVNAWSPMGGDIRNVGVLAASNFSGTSSGTNTGDQTSVSGNAGTSTKLATARSISLTGDMAWTTTFDGTANVTSAGTLATVNATPGVYGSAAAVPIVTVNAKGLVTSVTTAGLGTAATRNVGTSGVSIPLLSNANTWTTTQTFSTLTATTATLAALAFSGAIATYTAPDHQFVIDTTTIARLTSTGMTITGLLTATGAITAANFSGTSSGTNTGDQTSVSGNAGTATKLATARTIGMTGDVSWATTFDGSGNATSTATLSVANAAPGTTGSATAVPIITVNGKGLVTSVDSAALGTAAALNTGTSGATIPLLNGINTWAGAQTFTAAITAANFSGTSSGTNTGDQTSVSGNAGTATALQTGRTVAITGDLVWTSPAFNGSANVTAAGTLATVNATPGTTGSATAVPIVTVNAKGLVTSVTSASLGTAAAKNTGVTGNTVPLLDGTNTWTGGQTISSTSSTTTAQLSLSSGTMNWIGYNVNGVAAPTVNTRSAGTKIVLYPNITASNVDYAIGMESSGQWASVPSGGQFFKWYGGTTQAAILTGAGALTLAGALAASNYSGTHSGTSSGTNTGDQTTISGNAGTATKLASARTIAATGDLTWTTTFDGTANVTGAATLATVNGNVGTFGDANTLNVPVVTVDAKGRVSSASQFPLGTAASYNIGQSGGVVGLLNASNTWSALQEFSSGLIGISDTSFRTTLGMSGSDAAWTTSGGSAFVDTSGAQFKVRDIDNSLETALTVTAAATTVAGTLTAANISGTHTGSSSGTNTGDQTITLTGDISGTGTGSFATTLNIVNANVGVFGSATTVPVIGVNAKGLVTSVSSATLGTAAQKNIGTSGNTVPTLDVANTWTLQQQMVFGVKIGPSASAAAFTPHGNDTYTAFTGGALAPNTMTTSGNADLGIAGYRWRNLYVGTIDASGSITAANLSGTNTGDQTSVTGNAGTATKLATPRTITTTGDVTQVVTFDGSASVSAPGTLATVNSNVGTYGSATITPIFTVNGKGLVTAVSAATITPAWASITNKPTTISGYAITDAVTLYTNQNITAEKTFAAHVYGTGFSGGSGGAKWPVLGGFVLDTHPESNAPVISPFLYNDLAYLTMRGGTVTTNNPDIPNGSTFWFDGTPSYGSVPVANIPVGGMVVTITLPARLSYTSMIGIHFGNSQWAAKNIMVEVYSVTLDDWVVADTTTNWTRGVYQIRYNADGTGISQIRLTLDAWGASGRIAQIYAVNYSSKGSKNLYLGLDGGAMVTTSTVTNLNADLLDGQHGSFYRDAASMTGTIAKANLPTSFGKIAILATGTGASQSITLPYSGLAREDLMVVVNGLVQSWDDYTLSGTTLTLTAVADAKISVRRFGI